MIETTDTRNERSRVYGEGSYKSLHTYPELKIYPTASSLITLITY